MIKWGPDILNGGHGSANAIYGAKVIMASGVSKDPMVLKNGGPHPSQSCLEGSSTGSYLHWNMACTDLLTTCIKASSICSSETVLTFYSFEHKYLIFLVQCLTLRNKNDCKLIFNMVIMLIVVIKILAYFTIEFNCIRILISTENTLIVEEC